MTSSESNIQGLELFENAIDEEVETSIIARIEKNEWNTELKRAVQQYGQKYDYKTSSLSNEIITIPKWLLNLAEYLNLEKPDNIIINKYEPGEGIASHTDHVCFGNTIASLSLGSNIVMEFTKGKMSRDIVLKRRMLLKMSGDARYKWKHEIIKRKSDVIDGKKVNRGIRYSVTFRTIHK